MHGRGRVSRGWWPVALSLALLLVVGACGEGDADAPPAVRPETSGQVPSEFPEPPDITDYQELTASEDQIHVQWESDSSTAELAQFYDEALADGGWEVASRREGGDSTRFGIEGHGWEGAVTVLGGDPPKVLLQLGRPD
ncbi:MAG: hypothetical protein ACLFRT_04180 [Actinomycetota bacterium]